MEKNKLKKEVVTLKQDPHLSSYTGQIGTAVYLILSCDNYRMFRVVSVIAWLQMPIILKQICFFYNKIGLPIGYITWAYLTQEVEDRMLSDSEFLFHDSEWNEGERLWVIDFAAPKGMVREIVSFIRCNMFQEFSELRYVRRNVSGNIRKTCVWRRQRGLGA